MVTERYGFVADQGSGFGPRPPEIRWHGSRIPMGTFFRLATTSEIYRSISLRRQRRSGGHNIYVVAKLDAEDANRGFFSAAAVSARSAEAALR